MGKLVRIIAHTRMKIYIDGAYYAKEDAKISVFDHGLLYGDGVFEGIRIYHSRVFKLKEHIERLYYSAKAILLTIPMTPEAMAEAVLDACRQNQLENGYIRLIVTRGAGSLGLSPNSCENPSVIIIANEIQLYPPELYEKGDGNHHCSHLQEFCQCHQPGHQITELPEQHSGQDRGQPRRL